MPHSITGDCHASLSGIFFEERFPTSGNDGVPGKSKTFGRAMTDNAAIIMTLCIKNERREIVKWI